MDSNYGFKLWIQIMNSNYEFRSILKLQMKLSTDKMQINVMHIPIDFICAMQMFVLKIQLIDRPVN